MRKVYYDKKGFPRWKDTCELVHRTIAAEMLGRKLKHEEEVHHLDGDIKNYEKENLKVMIRKAHTK